MADGTAIWRVLLKLTDMRVDKDVAVILLNEAYTNLALQWVDT